MTALVMCLDEYTALEFILALPWPIDSHDYTATVLAKRTKTGSCYAVPPFQRLALDSANQASH